MTIDTPSTAMMHSKTYSAGVWPTPEAAPVSARLAVAWFDFTA
jgi:hypothetical protein